MRVLTEIWFYTYLTSIATTVVVYIIVMIKDFIDYR